MHESVSSPLIVVIWALICCTAVALSDKMWLRAIGAFMGAVDREEEEEALSGWAAERLWLWAHHILPIFLQLQTTGPGEMTAGAADCEINWTCDPKGRDQHPAWGGECTFVLTLAHDKGTAKATGDDWICGQFPRRDVSSNGWAALDSYDIVIVWDVLPRCWLLLEALFWREIGYVHRSTMSS